MIKRVFWMAIWLAVAGSAWGQSFNPDPQTLWEVLSRDDFAKGDLVLIERFNRDRPEVIAKVKEISERGEERVIVEFRPIAHWKYRVVVHNAFSPFVLVFSDTFHPEWGLFPVSLKESRPPDLKLLGLYHPIRGAEQHQAEIDELEQLLAKGWVSSLGNGDLRYFKAYEHLHQDHQRFPNEPIPYRIDYVSKVEARSLQNNNLSAGDRFDYYFKRPLDNSSTQFVANGFANAWVIEPEKVGQDFSGTWDPVQGRLEFLLVYQHQKYLDLGIFISLAVLAFTTLALLLRWLWRWGRARRVA